MTALVAGLALLAGVGSPAAGDPAPPPPGGGVEYEVKSAYLYNFLKFVEWPASGSEGEPEPFRLGVIGEDPFGAALDRSLEGKTAQGRPVSVVRLADLQALRRAPEICHLLFISPSLDISLEPLLAELEGRPVLTVGESPRFGERGGMINLVREGANIRFEINPRAAERAGLKISSKLLKLAIIVQEGEGE